MEELKQKWRCGDYTPVGYLVEILSTMAAIGEPIDIPNVDEFCQTWEMSKPQFHQAKAKLVERGALEEEYESVVINVLN
jgi:hypothetical protein